MSEKPFSERMGIREIKKMQTQSIDEVTKNGLWDALFDGYWYFYQNDRNNQGEIRAMPRAWKFSKKIWLDFFKFRRDNIPRTWNELYKIISERFFTMEWFEIYDFIEFVFSNFDVAQKDDKKDCVRICNQVLEREYVGYRLIDDKFVPITSIDEIQQVEEALKNPLESIKEHLTQAGSLLSDRDNTDYRNSIKESISAVESICKKIIGDDAATLGSALRKIQADGIIELHENMNEAFQKMYGYTNDAGGIRHSLMDGKLVPDFNDAKYMLVLCSAFINYLTSKSAKAGINLA